MTAKPILFIFHITEEKELAIAFNELVKSQFLGMLDVFVSSDESSVGMGQRWLENITGALNECVIAVIVCSPQSVKRPWINVEAGAVWLRKIEVIPLCHSGMKPSDLPLPLNLLQAATASEDSSLKLVFHALANALNATCPTTDFTNFSTLVKKFEGKYTFWDDCNQALTQLNQINELILSTLKKNESIEDWYLVSEIKKLDGYASFLKDHNVLTLTQVGGAFIDHGITKSRYKFSPLSRLQEILSDSHFKLSV